jgi:hypothetical protein
MRYSLCFKKKIRKLVGSGTQSDPRTWEANSQQIERSARMWNWFFVDQPSLKLVQLLPFLKNKALATKDMEVTHLGCATVHQLVTGFLLMHSEVDPVRNIARSIHSLSPEPSRSPMLIKHHPSHLTQGSVFPFQNTILRRCILTRKLVFKTQDRAKDFKTRVSEF